MDRRGAGSLGRGVKALPLAGPTGCDRTGVQARLFLLEEGLRRMERRGANPAAALLAHSASKAHVAHAAGS